MLFFALTILNLCAVVVRARKLQDFSTFNNLTMTNNNKTCNMIIIINKSARKVNKERSFSIHGTPAVALLRMISHIINPM